MSKSELTNSKYTRILAYIIKTHYIKYVLFVYLNRLRSILNNFSVKEGMFHLAFVYSFVCFLSVC